MPYWGIYCLYCNGYISDALLECIPQAKRVEPGYLWLFNKEPGACLACPYCGEFLGFDRAGVFQLPVVGTPVYRYGRAELEAKKQADGELTSALADWALNYRFMWPGTKAPFSDYTYAEQAPAHEVVP